MNNLESEKFENFLKTRKSELINELSKTIKLCCEKVRSDIRYDMAHTTRNMETSYYTNNKNKAHHPSAPGNPPAPDTGNLRNSINYEIQKDEYTVTGIVGTTQKNPPYGRFLEYGTSKMAPRPWLRPAMRKNNEFIRKSISETIKRVVGGGE